MASTQWFLRTECRHAAPTTLLHSSQRKWWLSHKINTADTEINSQALISLNSWLLRGIYRRKDLVFVVLNKGVGRPQNPFEKLWRKGRRVHTNRDSYTSYIKSQISDWNSSMVCRLKKPLNFKMSARSCFQSSVLRGREKQSWKIWELASHKS